MVFTGISQCDIPALTKCLVAARVDLLFNRPEYGNLCTRFMLQFAPMEHAVICDGTTSIWDPDWVRGSNPDQLRETMVRLVDAVIDATVYPPLYPSRDRMSDVEPYEAAWTANESKLWVSVPKQ